MNIGDTVGIQCTVQPGPFSGERLISFDTVDGPISGFVKDEDLKEISGQWYVRAVIRRVEDDVLGVRVKGSFFTTNGLASVPRRFALAA
ncbi:MAG: hypothetical protein K8F62_08075 [Pseudorhodoplanes sp.]|nr:hypothetical protein [Pseudorhodoplanes sp.]